jgi:hypothetical protein
MIDDIMMYEQVNEMKSGALPTSRKASARLKRVDFAAMRKKGCGGPFRQTTASCS